LKNLEKKIFSVFSLDKNIGGISSMIELSTSVMSKRAKKINLFLIKRSDTEKFLSNSLYKKKNVEIFKLTTFERYLFKIGFLKSKYTKHLNSSDIIFIHNTKIFKYLWHYKLLKPIILFFHTDKKKQIYDIKKIKKVFTVNTNTKKIINNIYGNYKAVCLPNCIDIRNKKYLFKQINNKLVLGTIGRLVEKKGFLYLINVIKSMRNIELHIAGDGPLLSKLKDNAKGYRNIKFLGWIKNKESFFKNIDIFCCPSKIEPFGLVILEAMSNSVPVISTKCKGPMDIIDNMKNGILVNIDNYEEMKNSIILLQGNKTLRKKISKNAFKTLKKKYSIEVYEKNFFSEIAKI
tara:strand:+ start:2564 stop:3604 length:1041 start_codon:yes stop_codon:yes gene_type:complete